ncbi:YDG domain-containing protein, partial [uncultured Selenomonas sp.]|uniref:YDG domain-containing protein n=1 Tax=uncultured Selenomonas sp. TaxID=159275 RepID=UPI0026332BB6
LTGTGAGNYKLNRTNLTSTGTIAQRTLNLALKAGANFDKTYDGNANVKQSLAKDGNYTLTNFAAGEGAGLALKDVTGQYSDKNAGTGKAVTFAGLTLDGEGAANYVLSATTLSATGDIAKRALTMEKTAGTHFTKVYDGNKNVTQTLQRGVNYTLMGAVEGEDDTVVSIDITSAHGAYQTKDAQEGDAMQDVDFTGITLTGTGAGNYTLGSTMTIAGAGKITPKELNVDLASGVHFDKTYDGDANVTQTLSKGTNYTLTNFVAGEGAGIELSPVTGIYADKNAGADKAVTFDGLTLTGTGAGNYKLNRTNLTSTGTIAQRMLGVTFTTAPVTKVYDGTTNAIAALSKGEHYTLTNFAAGEGDGITITGTGTFADKNVGTKAANFSALTLTGEGAGNYQLATTTHTGTGEITPRDLTLTADEKSVTQGEALPAFTGTAAGFADGEDESVFGTERLAFTSTVADTNTPGSYAVTGRIGSVAEGLLGNYRIRQASGNARAFTVTAMPVSGGILASLVQDAKPVFDDGYSRIVYLFGTPRPVRALTLGLYRFDAEDGLEIQGLNL